VQEQNSLS